MKFNCPDCGQPLEIESMYGGQTVQCPSCGASLTAPVPGLPESGASSSAPDPSVILTLQSSIDRGAMTITQFMAEKQIEGTIDLQSTDDKTSASSVLTSEQGRKYKLGDVVAAGGMGAILDAKDVNVRRNVAMKVMLEPDKAGKEQILRFIQEAQVTGQLEHPNIIPLHELGVDASGNVFYTMKFVRGRTLKDILEKVKEGDAKIISGYPLSHLLNIFQKVCDAIAFAHSKRVIHRDLKPENVMVGDYGEVQVMDWGLAKVLPKKAQRHIGTKAQSLRGVSASAKATADKKAQSQKIQEAIDSVRGDEGGEVLRTMDGSIMGTPGFMSPEQALGKTEEIDERTDIYALGAILYNILTLHVPITGSDLDEIIKKITTGDIKKPTEYNQIGRAGPPDPLLGKNGAPSGRALPHLPDNRVPESLSAVTMRALDVEAHRRYQTVKDLQKEIEAYQGGFATMAEDAGAWKQIRLLVNRHRGVFVSITGMLLVLLAAIGIYTHINTQERVKAQKALESFQDEQKKRQSDRKSSAPAMLRSARMFMEQQEWADAFAAVQTAIDYNPDLAEARLMQVALLSHGGEHEKALKTCREYASRFPDDKDAALLLNICQKASKKGVVDLARDHMVPLLSRHGLYKLAAGFMNSEKDRLNIYRTQLDKAWPGSGSNLTFNADGKLVLKLNNRLDVTDLSPLMGMPLAELSLAGNNNIRNISPLERMPLMALDLTSTSVTDLSPLKGIPLTSLLLGFVPVSDISPLKGMPLTALSLGFTKVADISPLKDMPLEWLSLCLTKVRDLTPLKGMQLVHINITNTKVKDVAVLKDMPLKIVYCNSIEITDLSFLKDKSLTILNLESLNINDISLLKGMPLTWLNVGYNEVVDISPLKGMPLTWLNVGHTKVGDLSPLSGMPLTQLTITGSYVRDLLPLKGMPLRQLFFSPKDISANISVLKEMKTLVFINDIPPDEFWKKYDAGEFK
ncbi:MAG: protein kinase [Kiritimatiellae bacterium]|nr:protein kinase [Kiritimatiellia bacterium]MDD5522971.1 protein kinase [Kiritimatiellia bacterium]